MEEPMTHGSCVAGAKCNYRVCIPMSNVIAFSRPKAPTAAKANDEVAYQATIESAISSLSALIDELGERIGRASNEAEIESSREFAVRFISRCLPQMRSAWGNSISRPADRDTEHHT